MIPKVEGYFKYDIKHSVKLTEESLHIRNYLAYRKEYIEKNKDCFERNISRIPEEPEPDTPVKDEDEDPGDLFENLLLA